jgi:hypothetical protein
LIKKGEKEMKKRFLILTLTVAMLFSLAGCQATPPKEEGASLPAEGTSSTGDTVSRPSETISSTHWSEVYYASEEDIVAPPKGFVWSETLWVDEDGIAHGESADGMGIYEILPAEDELSTVAIPILYSESGKVTPLLPKDAELISVALLEQPRKGYEPVPSSWEEIEALPPGRYHVVTRVKYTYDINSSACYEYLFTLAIGETPAEREEKVTLQQYAPDGWGISDKEIGDYAVATPFLEALRALQPTGEVEPALPHEEMDSYDEIPAEPGTFWVVAEGKLYRVSRDYDSVCLVDTHYGEGQVLEMTDAFASLLFNAWYYAPKDVWKGSYKQGDEKIELTNVFSAPSTVRITVKEIRIGESEDRYNRTDGITVELVSAVDQTVEISLRSQQSEDNLGSDDYKAVELKAGVPVTVEMSFYAFHYGYWVTLWTDNTRVEIQIYP